MLKIYAALAVTAVVALIGGTAFKIWLDRSDDRFAACRAGQVAGGDIGGPFTLVDQNGKTVTDKEVLAKPALVYFGYTFCPDVCPLDNARNAEAVDILEEMGLEVTPVFISVDPKRDTPAALKDFADAVHPRLIALTGTEDQIKAASKAYKTYYKAQEAQDDYYLVDHSTYTYFMMPNQGFEEFFVRDVTPDKMAETVACFMGAA